MTEYSRQILRRVASFIQQNRLMDDDLHTLFVGLSGGPDSVALLHILHNLLAGKGPQSSLQSSCPAPQIIALHCNFHLRGEESDRDQRFCEELCCQLGIALQIKEFDTRAYMQQNHLSLEMAARQLRYDWWNSLLSPHSMTDKIALGHHQDDSIETLLMNLMRGTGIQGLTGIVPYNAETHVIRPLLCLTRQEIMNYLSANGLSYIIDSTNAENDTLRNQVRNQLLPLMEQILPQARHGISTTMLHLHQSAILSDQAIEEYVSHHAVRHCIDGYPFEVLPDHCPYTYQLQQYYLNRSFLFDGQTATPMARPLPDRPLPNDSIRESFDKDMIVFPLNWRRWKQGDRMAPLGMNGHTKLISDLFSNAHYLPIQKQLAWVLEDASGQILWVPGLRMSHHARITASTQHVITLHYGESKD